MTEMQKQFEEWELSQKWCINKTGETYNNTYVGCSWQAWQKAWTASRAEIVVKLPEYEFCNHHRNILIDEVKTVLDQAGVSYE